MNIKPQRLKEIIQEEVAAFREQSKDSDTPATSVQAKGLADYGPPETALASAKMTIDKMAKTGQISKYDLDSVILKLQGIQEYIEDLGLQGDARYQGWMR